MIPKKHQLHWNTLDSEIYKKLREEPQVSILLPEGGSARCLRNLICQLKKPTSGNNAHLNHGNWNTIYYLHGDERRAVQKACDINEEYIRSALSTESTNDIFGLHWPEYITYLLYEEWQYKMRNE